MPTLADFARDRYLPHVRERLRSASNPETHLRLRILPFLGRKALDEVNQDDVAALRRKLLAEGLSGATVNHHLATMRSMFNLALKWQLFEGRKAEVIGMLQAMAKPEPFIESEADQGNRLANARESRGSPADTDPPVRDRW